MSMHSFYPLNKCWLVTEISVSLSLSHFSLSYNPFFVRDRMKILLTNIEEADSANFHFYHGGHVLLVMEVITIRIRSNEFSRFTLVTLLAEYRRQLLLYMFIGMVSFSCLPFMYYGDTLDRIAWNLHKALYFSAFVSLRGKHFILSWYYPTVIRSK